MAHGASAPCAVSDIISKGLPDFLAIAPVRGVGKSGQFALVIVSFLCLAQLLSVDLVLAGGCG